MNKINTDVNYKTMAGIINNKLDTHPNFAVWRTLDSNWKCTT